MNASNYKEAVAVLERVSEQERTAEWYYISAFANLKMNRQIKALGHIRIAINMDPNNQNYQQLHDELQKKGDYYKNYQNKNSLKMTNNKRLCKGLYIGGTVCFICGGTSFVLCC